VNLIKKLIAKYFYNFTYFYRYLKNKLFISVALSMAVGFLDGFGLAMFLPLLQMADGTKKATSEGMGNLSFIVSWLEQAGIPLTLVIVLAFLCFFFIFKGLVNYFKSVYQVTLQQSFIKKLRIANLNSFRVLNYKYFITSDIGRIQNTFTGEVDRVARAYQSYFQAFQQAIMVLVYMAFAFVMDYKFAILVSIGGLITNVIYKKIYANTKGASRKLTLDVHFYQGLIIQAVSNFKYLKATGQLKKYNDKLEDQVEFIEENNRRIGVLGAILNSSREPISLVVVCAVIFIQMTLLGSALSSILISLLFFYRALSSLMQMQGAWNIFLSVSGSLDNMTEFSKELKDNREKEGDVGLDKFLSSVELKNINFNYGETRILKDVTFSINKNETIAFVGESGSGKTTLVNIVSGLLPVDGGNIYVDGIDMKDLKISNFQERIGYITQDPVIFNDTIYNNVTFWAPKTPENVARFNETIKKAAIYDFVFNLPLKENAELGNNGINLSGGQKQRISIARELYKDIDILILDEATSALDSDTEKAIQENIDSLKGTYTILIVAHRLSTIKNADKIVVMKAGEIMDVGGFKELVDKTPYFKRMVELQELV
jgi:ABC-type multidrug transport system fused ATPase/permease subunit